MESLVGGGGFAGEVVLVVSTFAELCSDLAVDCESTSLPDGSSSRRSRGLPFLIHSRRIVCSRLVWPNFSIMAKPSANFARGYKSSSQSWYRFRRRATSEYLDPILSYIRCVGKQSPYLVAFALELQPLLRDAPQFGYPGLG